MGTWSGIGITNTNLGTFDPVVAGAGSHVIQYNYEENNCSYDEPITINVYEAPTAAFDMPNAVCENETAVISYTGNASAIANYSWDFDGGIILSGAGAGPYEVQWTRFGAKIITLGVEENGCTAIPINKSINIDRPLIEPEITCSATTNAVEFSWRNVPGANGYQVNVLSGSAGVQSGRTYTVDNLNPDDVIEIEVIALGTGLCGNSSAQASCTAQACPTTIDINITPVNDICLSPSTGIVSLNATITGTTVMGTSLWSGPGIMDATLGTFDPNALDAGVGSHSILLTYTEANCTYSEMLTIDVYPQPTADFRVNSPVCEGQMSTITYTGSASASANYTWSFDGGTIISGTGVGPYDVEWAMGGTKNISLLVEENGCSSTGVNNTLTVEEPLAAPNISCSVSTNSIEFTWDAIPGAGLYVVNVLSGPSGTQTGTSYLVENLDAGDEVNIEVFAIGGGVCGNSRSEQSCIAAACPTNVTVLIDAVGNLCLDANTTAVQLNATVQNGTGSGIGTWVGRGITEAVMGTFDPNVSGLGMHNIRYIYQEANCMYEGFVTINVVPPPTASFDLIDVACIDNEVAVLYTGDASALATYQWDFDGGMIVNGSGQGPYDITWSTAGAKTIRLTVIDGNCTSTTFSESVNITAPISAPMISCAASPTSVQFSWEEVTNATSYSVNVLSGPMGTLNGTSYLVDGLNPGDEVVIELTVISNDPCGNVTSPAFSCLAEACDPIVASISGNETICEGDDASLIFNFNGANGSFNVVYADANNNMVTIENIVDGHREVIAPAQSGTYQLVSAIANLNTVCPVTVNGMASITVNPPLQAGTAGAPIILCVGTDTLITLADRLSNADAGGTWEESSLVRSVDGGFNISNGTFSPASQIQGTYSFDYVVRGNGPCGEDIATVIVELSGGPEADAGDDKELDCDFTPVTLNGENSSSGSNFNYRWEGPNNITSVNATLDTETPGTYQLIVTDLVTGCTATDEVEVLLNDEVPSEISYLAIDPSCEGDEFGRLIISGVQGGLEPYFFALNDDAFSSKTDYDELEPGDYTLKVQDAKGCQFETSFLIRTPSPFTVDLGPDQVIGIGDSLTLNAISSQAVADVRWAPFEPVNCEGAECLTFFTKPGVTTTYYIEVINEKGCKANDEVIITVDKKQLVFIPTGFSPNGDVANQLFYIHAGKGVQQVLSFRVFNRWGDLVHEAENVAPNDPAFGWDGRHNGQETNAGVFIYLAEIEFVDGSVVQYQGDVTLIR